MDITRVDGSYFLETSFHNLTVDFFLVALRNPHTRTAYALAIRSFIQSVHDQGLDGLKGVRPIHVAAWVASMEGYAPTTIKQRLAAVNVYLDQLVAGGALPVNPAASVKGPRFSVSRGKTSVLSSIEARALLDGIEPLDDLGMRDRALIAVMLFTFARIGACLRLVVGDVYTQRRRLWLRLQEKGGKLRELPCHHQLEDWLDQYIRCCLADRPSDSALFPSFDRKNGTLSNRPLRHANAYQMVRRRAIQAGISTRVTNHTFRATGITAYLSNHGTLEMAAKLAGHSSTTTTQLYDRRDDSVTLDEIERIRI